jgi:4'-phosphopantetheinyl transferase
MSFTVKWSTPPSRLILAPTALHIWRTPLEVSADVFANFSGLLSTRELARASRFVFDRDRRHFTVARATLRLLLGRYLQLPLDSMQMQIEEGPRGKPFLKNGPQPSELKFNLSHSHGVAVFAVAKQRELGIDLEKIRPDFASREIAERYFSPQEVSELEALPPSLYTLGFFQCWTRKEAYVKARSEGLQIPLNSFSVTLTPGQSPKLTSCDSAYWSIYSFQPFPEFVAAVAAERFEWELSFYEGLDLV